MNRKVLRNKAYLMAHSFNRTKLFHSKKGWLMSSALVLAMLGVGASANQARVHAASSNPVNNKVQQPAKTKVGNNAPASASASASATAPASKASSIGDQAQQLHKGMMLNAMPNKAQSGSAQSSASATSTNINSGSNVKPSASAKSSTMNTLSLGTPAEQDKAWNFVQHGIRNNDYDPSNHSKATRHLLGGAPTTNNNKPAKVINNKSHNNTLLSAPTQKTIYSDIYSSVDGTTNIPKLYKVNGGLSDTKFVPMSTQYENHVDSFNGSDAGGTTPGWTYVNANGKISSTPIKASNGHTLIAPMYDGLVYKYNAKAKSIEFTNGQLVYNNSNIPFYGTWTHIVHANDMFLASVPHNKTLKSVSFDSDVKLTSDISNIFCNEGSNYNTLPIQSIDFSHLDTHNVTNMSGMFSNNPNLKSITFPDSFNTSNVSNMSDMFGEDSNLRSITFGKNFDTSKVTNMSDMFDNSGDSDDDLTTITISSPNTKFQSNAYNTSNRKMGDFSSKIFYPPSDVQERNKITNELESPSNNVIHMCLFSNNKDYTPIIINSLKNNVTGILPTTTTNQLQEAIQGNMIHVSPDVKSILTNANTFKTMLLPQYKKDDNDNYTSGIPVTLNDGQSHVGTWVQTPNPRTITDNVVFETSDGNGKYQIIGEPLQYYDKEGATITLNSSDVPTGYKLTNNNNSFEMGNYNNNPVQDEHNTHVFLVDPDNTKKTNLPAIPNTVNVKGTVTLQFSDADNNKVVRTITLPYLAQDTDDSYVYPLQEVDNNGEFKTPNDFLHQYIQNFDTNNYTYEGNGSDKTIGRIQPSKAQTNFNHGSTNLLTNNITLKYKTTSDNYIDHMTDNIEYVTNDGHTMGQELVQGSDGKSFNLATNPSNDQNSQVSPQHIPTGYQLANANNNLTYDGRTHNVQIVGKTIPSTYSKVININANEFNKPSDIKNNQKPTTTNPHTISLANHRVGDTITISPSEYTPTGYNATTSDAPIIATIVPEGQHDYGLKYNTNVTNDTIPYNYTYNYGNNSANPLTFEYVVPNKNGQGSTLVSSRTFNVPAGTNETPAAPTGYNIVKKTNSDKYQIVPLSKIQAIQAQSGPYTPTIPVQPKQANQLASDTNQGKVNVHVIEKNHKGDAINNYNVWVDEGSDAVGAHFTITPSDINKTTPNNFVPDVTDNNITGVITNNGAVTTNGTDTLIYDATDNPVTVHFNDVSNNNSHFTPVTVNGDPGSKITNANLPAGYHLPSDANYSFDNNGNLTNNGKPASSDIAIQGDPIQGKANIILQYQIKDPSDNKVVKTITNTADDAQVILNGEVGGSQTINPWKYWKTNFSLPSDVQKSDTIHFTPSDVNANDENGQQFNPTLVYTSSARQAGDIAVQYVDVDNNNNPIGQVQDIPNSELGNLLVGQEVELGQSGANKDVAINNNSDVHYVLNVPDGYHLEYKVNPFIMQAAQTQPSRNGYLGRVFRVGRMLGRPVGLFLTVGLSNPNAKPASTKSGSASSASAKASGSASANGTSTSGNSVAPSSTNSSASSSANNNSGSTNASSATNSNNSATQSGNSSAESSTNSSTNSASGNSANPSSSANSASSANTDNIMPFIPAFQNSSSASSSAQSANVTPASASISSVAPSFVINPNSSAIQSSATNNSATPSSSDTTVEPAPSQASQSDQSDTTKASSDVPVLSNHKNENTNASDTGNALVPTVHANTNTNDAGISGNAISPAVSGNGASDNAIVPSDNVSVPSDDVASSNNVANPNASAEKLPQTNEASNYTGITAMVALMLGVGLAGVDVERKYE